MKLSKFKKNLDVFLAAAFALIGLGLTIWVSKTCSGAGCLFGIALVLVALFDSVIFTIIALTKGFKSKNILKVTGAVISAVIVIVTTVFIFANIHF